MSYQLTKPLVEPITNGPENSLALNHIFHEKSKDHYLQAMDSALKSVSGFLINNKKPFSGIKPHHLKLLIDEINLDNPLNNYEKLFREIDHIYVNHATAYHLPKYIAHLNCPVLIPALAAEVLISSINSSQDTYDQSAGGTFIERKLIDWTTNLIGFGNQADGIFNAGGSQSNLMGLLLARDYYALEHLNHNIKLAGCPPEANKFRIFVSEQAHFSNLKNTAILGLGEQAIIKIETDQRFRIKADKLEHAIIQELNSGNIPIAIVGTAGTTDFGNIDPLQEIGKLAQKYKLWFHVDAAYGCGLLLTDKYKHLLNGIETAHSVTVDYHKSFFQPISSSAFLVKNQLHLNIIKHHADYLNPKDQDYDELPAQINKSIIQSTRRFDALKLWFTLRVLGRKTLGNYTETIIETAAQAAIIIAQDQNFELLSNSDLGALVFRFRGIKPIKANLCEMNKYIKKTMFVSGEVLVASTKINERFYLKFTIINPLTTLEDIQNILTIIKHQGNEYLQLN